MEIQLQKKHAFLCKTKHGEDMQKAGIILSFLSSYIYPKLESNFINLFSKFHCTEK